MGPALTLRPKALSKSFRNDPGQGSDQRPKLTVPRFREDDILEIGNGARLHLGIVRGFISECCPG